MIATTARRMKMMENELSISLFFFGCAVSDIAQLLPDAFASFGPKGLYLLLHIKIM